MDSPKYFVSVIWGYSRQMYAFSPEENYHLQALQVAKSLGYKPVALIRQGQNDIQDDPNFDKDITIIEYKNFFNFLWQLLKFRRALFYVNSYEWQSFLVPFIASKSIFMGHTHPVRQTKTKQLIQDFVFKFFSRVRLNNHEEKEFLIARGSPAKKLFVAPLAVSNKYFYKTGTSDRQDIVYFGNVTAKKNLPAILRAVNMVKKERPDIKLHIVGRISDPAFWPEAESLGLKDNIVAYGFMPLEDLAKTLNNFLVYVNSSFDEGQCVAVYNAALCGNALCLPSIMSFTGVFKDRALFHAPTDEKKLAENILLYLNNPAKAAEDNQKCREYILKFYSESAVVENLKKLFTF